MDRYHRGMPLEGRRQPQYHDGEFPDIAGLDLSEIQALKREAAEQVAQYQQDLKEQEQQKQLQKQQKYEQEIEDLKKLLTDAQKTQNNSLA